MPKIPGVNHLDAVRALEKAGFVVVRQGKHIVMSSGGRILTIPRHNPVNAFTLDARPGVRANAPVRGTPLNLLGRFRFGPENPHTVEAFSIP